MTQALDAAVVTKVTKRRSLLQWIGIILGLLFLLFGILLVIAVGSIAWWFHAQTTEARQRVESEVARIQAAGEPITTQDLYDYHRVPNDTPDITEFWLKALNSFDEKQFSLDIKNVPIIGDGKRESLSSDNDEAIAVAFLEKYDDTIRATLDAARQPGECRFPVKFEAGLTALLPHAQKLRQIARLLLLRSLWQSKHKDIDGAITSIDAIFAASNSLDDQLFLVEHLVRLAIFGVGLREIERVISEFQLTDEQLARIQSTLDASDIQKGLTRALYGDRASIYLVFLNKQMLAKPGNTGHQELVLSSEGPLTRPADCKISLELFGDSIGASREPFPGALTHIEKVKNRLNSLIKSTNLLKKVESRVTLLLFPAVDAAFEVEGRNLAGRSVVLVAIAAERYLLKTGSYPAQSTELVPDYLPVVPTDPFDGQPLRFTHTQEGLTIWSVGRDRKDDGGIQNTTAGEPDIVLCVRAKKETVP